MSDERRRCGWCRELLSATAPSWQRHCGKVCRQALYRARRVSLMEADDGRPRRIGYGDPPYPGTAKRYYGDQPTYAGEVDHVKLIAELVTFDGWALSTSERSVRDLYPLCPPETRLSPWVKPHGVPPASRGPHNAWEAVLYVPARRRRPGVRNWLSALPARGGGTLPGRKPRRFWQFLFSLLGAAPGDEFSDLFPGTGGGSRHWLAVSTSRRPGDGELEAQVACPQCGAADHVRSVAGAWRCVCGWQGSLMDLRLAATSSRVLGDGAPSSSLRYPGDDSPL